MFRRPRCALLDEPLRGVDPKDAEIIAAVLRRMAGDGCALVLTGHDVHTVLAAADQVVWLNEGCAELLGDSAQAEMHWRFRRGYLGPAR